MFIDPDFHALFRRYAEEDGVDLDAMSPYANMATMPSFRRATGEINRRAFAGFSSVLDRPVYVREPLWKRALRRLGLVRSPRLTMTAVEAQARVNQCRTLALARLVYGKPAVVRVTED